jgi:5-methylcytosine-specific restriction endonuclease McrA
MKKKHNVLVLNRLYTPTHICTWQKAMTYLCKDHVHALDRDYISYTFEDWIKFSISNAEDFSKIKTVNYSIAIPEIIALTKYDRLPEREVKYTRENIFRTYKMKCLYCGNVFSEKDLQVEHIIPRSQGGKSTWDNTVPACKDCNQKKANRTPQQAGMRLIQQPRRPRWINPLTNVVWYNHPCQSWRHFIERV